MHKKLSAILIVVIVSTIGFISAWLFFNHHLLVLEDGNFVEAEDVWAVGDNVFYRSRGEVDYVDGMRVKKWVVRFSLSLEDMEYRTAYHWGRFQNKPASVQNQPPQTDSTRPALRHLFRAFGSIGFQILPALIAIALFFILLRIRRPPPPSIETPPAVKPVDDETPAGPMLVSLDEVATFFLKIFKMQIEGNLEVKGRIKPLPSSGAVPGRLYELSVGKNGKWKSRRVTIRPLGEGTGSKSQCFSAIYDTHIVVKIPPKPIRDFDDYIGRIRYERNIVNSLEPRKCIIPNVSVIMDKVHHFENRDRLSQEQIEEQSVKTLKNSPRYQTCLKINGAFVFFMNLSRDYFLGDAMAGLQEDDRLNVVEEDARGGYDCQGFETKYGTENNWICFELNQIYSRFDKELEQLKSALGSKITIAEPQKKGWFFSHMAGLTAYGPVTEYPDRFLAIGNELLTHLAASNADPVQTYRQLVQKHARLRSFNRNRPVMEAIVLNLLQLLEWLDTTKVALRDLKPDNLLVVGDPNQYPMFLSSAEQFLIGLIDLETAVDYSQPADRLCLQPQLGGTPSFATPSHFFTNKVLRKLYTDINKILHLQDWHALTGIIFETVTGRRLFQSTAGHIPQTVRMLQLARVKQHPPEGVYGMVNSRFWQQAEGELHKQIGRHEKQLEAVTVILPATMKKKLEAFLKANFQNDENEIQSEIENQSFMRNDTQKKKLYDISYPSVRRTIARYKKSKKAGEANAIAFLEKLGGLKKDHERIARMIRNLENPLVRLTVKDLLVLMFEYTSTAMAIRGIDTDAENLPTIPDGLGPETMTIHDTEQSTLGFTHTVSLPEQ